MEARKMPLSGTALWSIWLASFWVAFFFRPKRLILIERPVPIAKRFTVALLGLLYCFAVPTLVIMVIVFISGLARGFAGALS